MIDLQLQATPAFIALTAQALQPKSAILSLGVNAVFSTALTPDFHGVNAEFSTALTPSDSGVNADRIDPATPSLDLIFIKTRHDLVGLARDAARQLSNHDESGPHRRRARTKRSELA
ncbi:MAG TPA: hypothetical protein VFU50_09950 [Terriglobales bacterium]|nr:hypothetical protein [Terriglobales bacterium]